MGEAMIWKAARDRLQVLNRFGWENFLDGWDPLPFTLLNYWEWGVSRLESAAARAALAEFVVARTLEAEGAGPGEVGRGYDLTLRSGVRIKVTSESCVRDWSEERLASIAFDVAPRWCWDERRGRPETALRRPADIYVFALLVHAPRAAVNPVDVGQWTFYVAAARSLDAQEGAAALITLRTLESRAKSYDPSWRGPLHQRQLKLELESIAAALRGGR